MQKPLFVALGYGASDLGEVPGLGSPLLNEQPGMVAKAQGNQRAALCGTERRLVDSSKAQPDTWPLLGQDPW